MITARKFTVQIEEKLLLKLLSFFGYDQSESGILWNYKDQFTAYRGIMIFASKIRSKYLANSLLLENFFWTESWKADVSVAPVKLLKYMIFS